MTDPTIVVGIMAYNEAANIEHTVSSFLHQTIAPRINRIIVVASGCTDDTCGIVKRMAAQGARLVLVEEATRAGKTVAINTFLGLIHESIVVISSADLILENDTLERLIEPFTNPAIGMAGAHPVPTNSCDTFTGFAVNLMWELHHRISLGEPKMGELVAFRNQLISLDPTLLNDDLSLESQIRARGLAIAYASEARVFNHGPESLREFMAQRVRWCVGNIQIQRRRRMSVSTMSIRNLLSAARALSVERRPRFDWLMYAAAIEAWCRLRAYLSLAVRPPDRYRIWEPVRSTKTVTPHKL